MSYTISDNAAWISCTPTSGTSTGEHDNIVVNYSTSGLSADTYYGTITINASGVSNTPQTISVTLPVNQNGSSYLITGRVTYNLTNRPLSNIFISSFNSQEQNPVDAFGYYQIDNIQAGTNIILEPKRPQDISPGNSGILVYDAALAAQIAIGLRNCSQLDSLTADANKDLNIGFYDAYLIAQHAIELDRSGDSHVGEWLFSPSIRRYNNLVTNISDANFNGLVIGDIDANWQSSTNILKDSKSPVSNILVKSLVTEDYLELTFMNTYNDIYSCSIHINYDVNHIMPYDVRKGVDMKTFELLQNNQNGRLVLCLYSPYRAGSNQDIVTVKFRNLNVAATLSGIQDVAVQINNQPFETICLEETVISNVLHEYKLHNYPNPFNNNTKIIFTLPQDTYIKLDILNYIGEIVKTFNNHDFLRSGEHIVEWDGYSDSGVKCASGLYFCQLIAAEQRVLIKIVLTQ